MEALQSQFVRTRGGPLKIGEDIIVQQDIIDINRGVVDITFLSESGPVLCGLALKSAKGYIVLSDGSKRRLVFIWNQPNLPERTTHEVRCPDGQLRIWNIYQVNKAELTKADYWTNNAGMVVELIGENQRKYSCSDGIGPFDKTDMVAVVHWRELS